MGIDVLGISSSPIENSNTDRAVKAVLEATGLETAFMKLSELRMEPCRACLGCVETNECTVEDDMTQVAKYFNEAPAFVLGAFTPYSSLDARAKTFMERMYCLRHQEGLSRGKVGGAVITTACPPGAPALPPAAETATSQIAYWMMEEGMVNVGSMVLLGNVPCISCGHGDECAMSGITMIYGPEANVESVGVNWFEKEDSQLKAALDLGRKIRDALAETAV